MRSLPALALLATALLAVPVASAQTFAPLAAGDAADGKTLVPLNAVLGFIDSDLDGRADAEFPAEPVYLDLDGSRTITYGDLRLTGFHTYAAGTSVDVTNADLGRTLAQAPGWLAGTGQGGWLMDLDGSRSVTVGDVRLTGTFGARAGSSDPDARATLEAAQQQVSTNSRVGYVDLDNDGGKDASEPVYFDLDPNGSSGFGKATAGDLKLAPSGAAVDDAPTRQEFEQALEQAGVEQSEGGGFERNEDAPANRSTWGTPEVVLLLLGLVNLVGLLYVYAQVRSGGRPRNPFK